MESVDISQIPGNDLYKSIGGNRADACLLYDDLQHTSVNYWLFLYGWPYSVKNLPPFLVSRHHRRTFHALLRGLTGESLLDSIQNCKIPSQDEGKRLDIVILKCGI